MTRIDTFTSEKENTPLLFEDHLKPILLSMKLFGLYFEKKPAAADELVTDNNGSTSNHLKAQKNYFVKTVVRKLFNSRIYSLVVLVVLTISGIRYIPSFWIGPSFHSGIVFEVITLTFALQCLVNRLVLFISFAMNNRFAALKRHFNNSVITYINDKVRFQKYIKTSITVFTCLAWIVFTVEITGTFFMLISNVLLDYIITVNSPLSDSVQARIISCLITLYAIATWSFTICHIMCVSCILYYEFDEVNHALEKTIKEEGKNAISHIEKYRVRHEHLCEAVGFADVDFKYLIANCYVTNLFMCCFVLYNLINDPGTTFFFLILEISWTIFNLSSVLIVSWVAALVNESAHSPLDNIYKMDVSEATPQQLGQLNLFLSRLTGTSIGFTFVGMFTVTKEVIPTLTGLFVTYFFLLLQFKI